MLQKNITIKRNQKCPCGSGEKYKQCCGRLGSVGLPDTLNPDLEQQLSKGQASFDAGDFDKAVGIYKNILTDAPNNAKTVYLLGLAQIRSGWVNEGIESLKRSVVLEPNNSVYWNEYGQIAEESGDTKTALSCYEKAHELNYEDNQPIYKISRLLVALKDWRQAIKYLEMLGERAPDDLEVIEMSALAYIHTNQWEKLKLYTEKGLKVAPDNKRFQFYRAQLMARTSPFDVAYKELKRIYEQDPDTGEPILTSIIQLLEFNHKLEEAENWIAKIPGNAPPATKAVAGQIRAKIQTRDGNYDNALSELNSIDGVGIPLEIHSTTYYLQGQILDKLGNFPEAFAAFQKANQMVEKSRSQPYRENDFVEHVGRIKKVFTGKNFESILDKTLQQEKAQIAPIFILGFPRSGTTLVEQILSSHPSITAGDELISMSNLERQIPRIMGSDSTYPECIMELKEPGDKNVLSDFRNYYIQDVFDAGVPKTGWKYFTDKELSNTNRMGLINLIFPNSNVIHVIRHPLDSCLSSYIARFGTGHLYSTDLKNTATRYFHNWNMINHFKQELKLKCHAIRYEDIVTEPEEKIRELLKFIGVPWDKRCLDFHENKRVARTASYEQVTKKLYKGSMYRYRNYREQLEEIIPILEPVMEEMGYDID